MATIITKDNCLKSLSCDYTVMTVVIREDVTELHPTMFTYCSNLHKIENHARPGIVTDDMLKGCRGVNIIEMGEESKSEPEPEPEPEPTQKPKPVIPPKKPAAMVTPISRPKSVISSGLDAATVNKIYYAIHPSRRSIYGSDKNTVVEAFLSKNYRRRMV